MFLGGAQLSVTGQAEAYLAMRDSISHVGYPTRPFDRGRMVRDPVTRLSSWRAETRSGESIQVKPPQLAASFILAVEAFSTSIHNS